MKVQKCSNCYWEQDKGVGTLGAPLHHGCYEGSKWRKWIAHNKWDVPNILSCWKEKTDG